MKITTPTIAISILLSFIGKANLNQTAITIKTSKQRLAALALLAATYFAISFGS